MRETQRGHELLPSADESESAGKGGNRVERGVRVGPGAGAVSSVRTSIRDTMTVARSDWVLLLFRIDAIPVSRSVLLGCTTVGFMHVGMPVGAVCFMVRLAVETVGVRVVYSRIGP